MDIKTLRYRYNDKVICKSQPSEDGEILLAFDTDSGNMYEFNDVASELLLMIKESMPVQDIIEGIIRDYDVKYADIEEDLVLFFERVLKLGIIRKIDG